jgi:ABC-2 type transport system ATP-binding protein
VTLPVEGGSSTLVAALRELDAAGIALHDVALRRPTLDDVFLSLTGHPVESKEASEQEAEDGDPAADGVPRAELDLDLDSEEVTTR